MLKEDLINNNPLRVLNLEATATPRMGLIMARAGVGKTAILVQLALDSMLRDNQVLHVSIGQTLEKTRVWYDDMFKDIAAGAKLTNANEVHDEMNRNRMIMPFNEETFTVGKLKERLNDLISQNIFNPTCILIDGFDCTSNPEESLGEMRRLMEDSGSNIWLSAISHRDDDRVSETGIPAPCHGTDQLFETVILLEPNTENKSVALNIVKDETGTAKSDKNLCLDPATLLIMEK